MAIDPSPDTPFVQAAPCALRLHPSALARDAALDERCRKSPGCSAAWAEGDSTADAFFRALDRLLPPVEAEAPPLRLLEGAARTAVLHEAWRAVRGREEDAEPTRAALDAAGRLIAAWKGANLEPGAVERAAGFLEKNNPRLAERLARLGKLWRRYEQRLGGRWTDREGWEREVIARLVAHEEVPASLLSPGALVRAEGLLRLNPAHRALLQRLAAMEFPLELSAAVPPNEFPLLARTFGPLFNRIVALSEAGPQEIERVEAPTPYAEVYAIGTRVRRWIAEEGIAPERIAVAFRDLGPYSQFVADVFGRLNVPYFERRGEPLAFQPLVRAALCGLNAARGDFSREELFRFLCAGPVDAKPLSGLGGEDAPDAFALRQAALDARADRFFGREAQHPAAAWAKRLRLHAGAIRQRDEAAALRMERCADALFRIVERLHALRTPRPPAEFAAAWRTFWQEAGLGKDDRRNTAPRDRESLAALDDALEEVAAAPGGREGTVDLDAFALLLEDAISARGLRGAGREKAGGVRVLNCYDLRGLSFERLVLGGLNERDFPRPAAPDPLLGDGVAAELRGALARAARIPLDALHGVEPRLPEEVREEEQALFEAARRACTGTWVLARCKTRADGSIAPASVFWDRPEFREFEARQAEAVRPAPPLDECLADEEAELRAAWILGGGRDAKKDDDHAAERDLAAALFAARAGRLPALAGRAGVEQARERFFENLQPDVEAETEAEAQQARAAAVAERAGAYDGGVAHAAPEAGAVLKELFLRPVAASAGKAQSDEKTQSLSPSSLESLAGCAFKFLQERVLGLESPERPGEELDASGRGSIWHDVLAGFYRELLNLAKENGRQVAVLDPARRNEYAKRLKARADKVLERAPERYFTGHPGLWGVQRRRIEAGLDGWLDHELRDAAETKFHPAGIEFSFNARDGHAAPPVRVPFGGKKGAELELLVEGRIDRVDLRLQDPGARTPRVTGLRLIDYKQGALKNLQDTVKPEEVRSLRSAQLPIYLLAAVQYLQAREAGDGWAVDWDELEQNACAALYALRSVPEANRGKAAALLELFAEKKARRKKDGPEIEPLKFEEFIDLKGGNHKLYEKIRELLAGVFDGRFAVAPDPCAGDLCAARFLCRFRDLPDAQADGGGAS
ncbi:MAG: PD-(D/E)XK nuclease family protein [Planctomycetes bacterium]|nr:PD-(D/E)XK nuclease family protein [Planctomycetota bacterium]